MKINLFFFMLILSFSVSLSGAWQDELFECLLMPDEASAGSYLGKVLEASPDWSEVARFIQKIPYHSMSAGKLELKFNDCTDGKKRPWVVYIPGKYDPAKETPLLIVLHGGVSRKDLKEDPLKYASENEFVKVAEEEGWFLLFPFGQSGATWWDAVGMANIRSQILSVKRDYNIDEDRIWIEGFSDGASAAFLYAMINSTPYAAFIALNGHMGVGSLDAKLDTYASNFVNTNIYAVTSDEDGLYPTGKMRKTLDMAISAGGNILYRTLSGDHSFSYAQTEIPRIVTYLKRTTRDPHPTRLIVESSTRQFGRCKWLQINSISLDGRKDWHVDHNTALSDSRITIGFFPDQEYRGEGIKIGGLAEGDTLASGCGLKTGDILVRAGTVDILKMDDLDRWKGTVKRGDGVSFTVKRGEMTLEVSGQIPETQNYYIFTRTAPSGRIDAVFSGNTFLVATSRVSSFSLFIHPDQVNLDKKIEVIVDGELKFCDFIKPDLGFMISNYLEHRDRKLMYVARLDINL